LKQSLRAAAVSKCGSDEVIANMVRIGCLAVSKIGCAEITKATSARHEKKEVSMLELVPNAAALERRLAGLPVIKHPARQVVLGAGSKTGRLFFLINGAVEVIKDGVSIANVSTPGSVFGEQAVLLDQPHSADVRTLEQSEFYVADAQAMLAGDPTVALYVAAILARRLDAANRSLIEVKQQIESGEPLAVIGRSVEKMEEALSYSDDASLVYAGYPYDPFRPDKSVH
jgi:CRP/FNR family cyclic AMP-dependent transcriptional regulator